MGLFSFVKEAGERLFGRNHAGAQQGTTTTNAAAPGGSGAADASKQANDAFADAIVDYIRRQNLDATALTVTFDGETATVYGVAPDQETKEKIILCCGNVQGVASVNDQMSVEKKAPEARFYTVVKGDTLSKIAKEQYGNANQYMRIFEANKPMLAHPDKIYPGQVLRIPT
jgi:nucleoid-associated protein YgaU